MHVFSYTSDNGTNKKKTQPTRNTTIPSSYTKTNKSLLLANYKSIALANTIYKVYTNTLMTILTSYIEQYIFIYFNQ